MGSPKSPPTFAEAFRFWLKLGFISFGGPTGQIAIMHAELVERKKWISEERFLHALNFCMLLPGPEAMQLAVYSGWLLHRVRGGIVAGVLFVLPSACILWLLSVIYVTWGELAPVSAIFGSLKPAVVAIVACALLRMGSKALKNAVMWALAVLAFVAIFVFHAGFPWIIATAAAIGFLGSKFMPATFQTSVAHSGGGKGADSDHIVPEAPSFWRSVRVCVICLLLWWTPILLTGAVLGWRNTLYQEGLFFSKAAMVTFGGAYAVLPYVAQEAVGNYHWLQPGQMIDGLALAETTPGPLIMVLQFVGFIGSWRIPAPFAPLVAATLGAAITTWATFLPCFLWIFLAAPWIERLRGNKALTAALSAVTAAVVGVMLNLAVWFGWHVFLPDKGGVNLWGVGIALVAFAGMRWLKWEIIPVIAGAAVIGILRWAVGLEYIK